MTPRIARPVRFEHHTDVIVLGIGVAAPRLSWQISADPGFRQIGYELTVSRGNGDVESSGRVESDEQVLVPWPFTPLGSRERATVRVRVFGEGDERSPLSEEAVVEAGLLEPSDWQAVPVGPAWPEDDESDRRPPLVRTSFRLRDTVSSARLYVSAHGLQETEINGRRVGREAFSPGWTVYGERLRYYTYDVTDFLDQGENAIGAWLADGWYRGRIGFNGGYRNLYGRDISYLAQLEVVYADGSSEIIASDSSWAAGFGPILVSGLYDGEHFDARQHSTGWSTAGFCDDSWSPVAIAERDPATLVAPDGPPVRCTEELLPVSVEAKGNGRFLLDFGQNLVGRLKVRIDGPAGSTITMRHAEVIQDGELYTRPLRKAAATDVLILNGEHIEWEPRFTLHGFRYAEISGVQGEPSSFDVVARVYHTDMERTGWFETSDPLVNRLHENVRWSMRGNFVDIPTDCPQRDERLGWTGDIQVFAPTASYLYDVSGMLSSWLKDVAEEQLPDGTIPWYVPVIPGGSTWTPIEPGAVWGDAAVLTPWTLYERYADAGILEQQFSSAKAWVDLVNRLAGPSHLWDTGRQLGDWLDPAAPPEDPADARTDRYLVATAYFAQSTKVLAAIAELIGRHDDASHYRRLAADVRAAFVDEYFEDSGRMTSDAQTAYALAVRFELLPDDEARAAVAQGRLAQLVRDADNRIATGFAGTPLISDALTESGALDVAYDLLLERECPSWMYTVVSGGTTIWERWDSQMPDGSVNPGEMTSFNHYALGAVADWMHRVIGGIAPLEPGYRRVLVKPRPGGGLTSSSARHLTPYGELAVRWTREEKQLSVVVEVPIGVRAQVELPGADALEVGPGHHEFTSDGVTR